MRLRRACIKAAAGHGETILIATGTQRIASRLDQLRANSADIDTLALISVEGLIIARSGPADLDDERIGAMSAAMLALGERIAAELGRGPLDQVMIQGEDGYALLMTLDEHSALCALAAHEARLGLLYLDLRRIISELRGGDQH